MKTSRFVMFMALFLAAAIVPAVRAQQQQTPEQSQPPIPAYHSPLASAADNGLDQDTSTQPLTPDTRPLSGAENLSLGAPQTTHSYWQPYVNVSVILDSNPNEAAAATGWTTWSSLSGGVKLVRESGNSNMSLNYLAGGLISNSGTASDGIIQTLDFKEILSFRRTTVSFTDQASYLPEAAFGFGGLGVTPAPIGGALGPGFIPNQTILTPRGQDLVNASIIEVDRYLTSRTSLTFVGGYSLLHYFDTNLLNYGDATFQGGYNYQMTRKDTIALSYLFSAFRYSNFDQSINSHTVSLSYARRVTGRLAFQVSSGPQFVFLRIPLSGGSESTGTGTTSHVYWSALTALQYQLRRGSLGVSYSHGVGGGAGVLAGSIADTATGTASRELTRTITGTLNIGYSHNNGVNVGVSTPVNQDYNYWFGGVNLTRVLGRTLNVNLSYQAQYQDSSAPFCVGPACGTSVLRHLISFGVGWRKQPVPLE